MGNKNSGNVTVEEQVEIQNCGKIISDLIMKHECKRTILGGCPITNVYYSIKINDNKIKVIQEKSKPWFGHILEETREIYYAWPIGNIYELRNKVKLVSKESGKEKSILEVAIQLTNKAIEEELNKVRQELDNVLFESKRRNLIELLNDMKSKAHDPNYFAQMEELYRTINQPEPGMKPREITLMQEFKMQMREIMSWQKSKSQKTQDIS